MIRAMALACVFALLATTAHAQIVPARPEAVTPTTPAVGPDGKKIGVLVPQGSVDPGMNKGAPSIGGEGGAVLKPPGTTGGQPGAVAK